MRNDHGATGNKIPGLGDIPGLGRLFGSNKDAVSKSELVLSITPRVVRNLPYQSPSDMEFTTGTETSMHIQAPDRSLQTTVTTDRLDRPVAATTPQVVIEKP
ncbi:Bacterial type II and III secretion system protein [compost metagenome]